MHFLSPAFNLDLVIYLLMFLKHYKSHTLHLFFGFKSKKCVHATEFGIIYTNCTEVITVRVNGRLNDVTIGPLTLLIVTSFSAIDLI